MISRSGARRFSIWVALAVVACPAPVWAQAREAGHLSAGVTSVWRDAGSSPRSVEGASFVRGVAIGFDRAIKPGISLGASVEFQQSQSLPWHFSYAFAEDSDQVAVHRDLPLLIFARLGSCPSRACAQLVLGAGVNVHHLQPIVTATCASGTLVCTPVVPARSETPTDTQEWMLAASLEFPIRVSPVLAIVPTVRISEMFRGPWLTEYVHRGPASNGGEPIAIGVLTRWTLP